MYKVMVNRLGGNVVIGYYDLLPEQLGNLQNKRAVSDIAGGAPRVHTWE